MLECTGCGAVVPEGARFCPACGTPLEATPPRPAPRRSPVPIEERRRVTALFCDLVGFTAMSEAADPEDVRRVLDAYFAAARAAVERHGGIVEKFIGDAVVGVFGIPVAHEDDALRAVRAGLDICEAARGLSSVDGSPLRLRVGVNTGEALVRLGVASASGEAFMTGDAINTASRIQSAAPELGVAVGLATWQATRVGVDYEELEPATLKGKAAPVRIFAARAIRSERGLDPSRPHAGRYVGRGPELERLAALVAMAQGGNPTPVAVVTGAPGLGKSRLVLELETGAGRASGITWRRGRCLSYGDEVTYWALGEVVKQHAGILEGDDAGTVAAKLEAIIDDGPDRSWKLARLLPLVGLGSDEGVGREEAFLAWRAFLRTAAGDGTAVIVIEDIHWADDALLSFVAGIAAEPIERVLVIVTARPDLFVEHPELAAHAGIVRLDLEPLADESIEDLIAGILGAVVPHELHGPLLERAQGNPLFAEEYVRLLGDLDLLVPRDAAVTLRDGASIPLPDSITALIAARLDALPPGVKPVLADASVIGTTFWAGGVAAIAGVPATAVGGHLAEAGRLELVRRSTTSTMVGETEYSFWHVLTRDVAYAQLPRAARAARHIAAAEWLAARAGDRLEDIAHLLAFHTATALELSRATGDSATAERVLPDAIRFHRLAGDRALPLDPAAAGSLYRSALVLAGEDAPDRLDLLRAVGVAAVREGDYHAAVAAYQQVLRATEVAGEPLAVARALLALYSPLRYAGTFDPSLLQRALEILEALPPREELVDVLVQLAVTHFHLGAIGDARASIDRALAVAAAIGGEPPPMLLVWRGSIRSCGGDPGWREDGLRGLALARAGMDSRAAGIAYNETLVNLYAWNGPAAARDMAAEGLAFAVARGLGGVARILGTALASALVEEGRYAEAVRAASELLADARTDPTVAPWIAAVLAQAHLRAGARQEAIGAADLIESMLHDEPDPSDPDSLLIAARVRVATGDPERASALVRRVLGRANPSGAQLREGIPAAVETGELDLARAVLAGPHFHDPFTDAIWLAGRALVAEAEGRLEEAIEGFQEVVTRHRAGGWVSDEGIALIGLARCLLGIGRVDEAREPLAAASAIFTPMGAHGLLAEVERVRAQIEAADG